MEQVETQQEAVDSIGTKKEVGTWLRLEKLGRITTIAREDIEVDTEEAVDIIEEVVRLQEEGTSKVKAREEGAEVRLTLDTITQAEVEVEEGTEDQRLLLLPLDRTE